MNILKRDDKPDLAYVYTPGNAPMVVFCGGYASDMQGTKATYFEEQCKKRGQAYLRLDYSGHGQSGGAFEDGTISSWKQDVLDILAHVGQKPVLLIGSSMGGWVSLLIAKEQPDLVYALIGIAAAPDFTVELYENDFSDAERQEMQEHGLVRQANDYSDEPYIFTKGLIEDGYNNLLLTTPLNIAAPVHLFQGKLDEDVPWKTAETIKNAIAGGHVDITLIEDGDHRLSRDQDLALIDEKIAELSLPSI